jgi:hypothetical protein
MNAHPTDAARRRPRARRPAAAIRLAVAAAALGVFHSPCRAAPDDFEVVPQPPAARQVMPIEMIERNLDSWIYQGVGGPEQGKARLESHIKVLLDELERLYELSEEQRKKIALAAHGDKRRFLDQVEAAKARLRAAAEQDGEQENRQNLAMQRAWQEAQVLQQRLQSGVLGPASLARKILPRTLTPEQYAAFEAIDAERTRFRYRAAVEAAVVAFEDVFPLREAERKALMDALVERTPPPKTFGNYNYNYVLYRITTLPADALEPHFGAKRWKLFQGQTQGFKGLEQFLVQNGIMDAAEGK